MALTNHFELIAILSCLESQTSYIGNMGPWPTEFAKSCETIGIRKVADFNTPKGTLGVSKVSNSSVMVWHLYLVTIVPLTPPPRYFYRA